MNFIRLPSLRLNHDDDNKIEKEVTSVNNNNYHRLSKDSSHLLPSKWRSEQSQQYYDHQQYITTSNENNPLSSSSSSSIQIKLKSYPQQYGQSYAQEMIPYPLINDHLITSSSSPSSLFSSSSNNNNNSNINRSYVKRRRRPPHSYASMIAQAILNSKEQKMTLRDIYNWVQEKYPHLYESNETGWQNTIRHNLSLNRCFYKLPKSSSSSLRGKGSYWTIDIQQLYQTTFGHYLLDTYSSTRGFEYWSNESPLSSSSSSSSTISTTSFSPSNSNFIMDSSMMDIDDDKDINQSQHDSICNENVDDHHLQNKSNPSSSFLSNNDHFIQPASIITLQHHQQHLKLSKSTPSFISKSKNHSNNHLIKHSTSHPNSLHYILN